MADWLTGFDAVSVGTIPANAQWVLAYIDGAEPTFSVVREVFPDLPIDHILTVTTGSEPGARICDCELGDDTPWSAALWAYGETQAGRRPTIYAQWANYWSVVEALAYYGLEFVRDVDYFGAWWNDDPSVYEGWVAHQYYRESEFTFDMWVAIPSWLGIPGNDSTSQSVPVQEDNMIASDPLTGGYWIVRPDGSVYQFRGAPYLGGLNTHPEYKAGGKGVNGPCTGIASYGIAGEGGYVLSTLDAKGVVHPYEFPRDGSLAPAGKYSSKDFPVVGHD